MTISSGPSPETAERVRSALAYVPVVARRYGGGALDQQELVAAGNLGLVQAALRFDPGRRVRFLTYADWWIRKAILEAFEAQARAVRLPRNQIDRLRRIERLRADWIASHGCEPTAEELAGRSGMRLPALLLLARSSRRMVSLDQPARADERHPLNETLPDPRAESPQGSLVRRELADRLRRLLTLLSTRERTVLRLRFGLDDDSPGGTLRQVARRLGISRERVRQIELRALLKLRRLF
jgi:RNA polymerase sigma factor (sigma-70 family)